MDFTYLQWAQDFLTRLSLPLSPANLRVIIAWEKAEGGHFHNAATFNPLNTSYDGYGGVVAFRNIRAYPDYNSGISASVATILRGLDIYGYRAIVDGLRVSDPTATIDAIGSSKWGTGLDLLRRVYSTTQLEGGTNVKFVPRSEWGARNPRATTPMPGSVRGVACHWEGPHMGTPDHGGGGVGLAAEDMKGNGGRPTVEEVAKALLYLHREREELSNISPMESGQSYLAVADSGDWPNDYDKARVTIQSSTCYSIIAGIQAFHMDTQGWNDIAYNYLSCPHGYVFEGRGAGVKSGANGDALVNSTHYAVCYLGGVDDPFTDPAKDAFNDAAALLSQTDGEWVGHRDLTSTSCPGDEIYAWVQNGHPRATPDPTDPSTPTDPTGDDDMPHSQTGTIYPGETIALAPPPGRPEYRGQYLTLGHARDGEVAKVTVHLWGQSDKQDAMVAAGAGTHWQLSSTCEVVELTSFAVTKDGSTGFPVTWRLEYGL